MSARDVDLSEVFPLERYIRRWPRIAQALLLALFSLPAWAGGLLAAFRAWSQA